MNKAQDKFAWSTADGVVEKATGKQIVQLIATGATKKERAFMGRLLVDSLNELQEGGLLTKLNRRIEELEAEIAGYGNEG